jgi:hypothetical protein
MESGYEWVLRTLDNRTSCYNIFRMSRLVFNKLHNLLCGVIWTTVHSEEVVDGDIRDVFMDT